MQATTILQLNESDFDEVLDRKLRDLQRAVVMGQFSGRLVSVNTVAEIHNVHRDTVIRYATAGLIPHAKTGKLYKFDLSHILQINFNKLKIQ